MPALERKRMSFDDYRALPPKPKVEWVDGEAVIVNVPPNLDHSDASYNLYTAIKRALPSVKLYTDVDLWLPRNRIRRPDIAVYDRRPPDYPSQDVPIVAIEVLSPGTHTEDLLSKPQECAEAGVAQFWAVDPEARTLEIYRRDDLRWDLALRLDRETPAGDIAVDDYGTVPLDLNDLYDEL